MRLIMDGTTISDAAEGVAQALETARAQAEQLGRLVIEVRADGEPADDLLGAPPEGTAGVGEISVTTADRSAFLRETLAEARDALARTREDQQRAAELVDSGEVAQAIGALRGIVEGWQMVRSVVDQTAALAGVALDGVRVGDETGDAVIRSLAQDLVALRDAVGREDWSALSDALACDLDARAGQWIDLMGELTSRAVGAGSS